MTERYWHGESSDRKISILDMDGFFEKNERNAYSFNNVTTGKNPNGSVTIHFGGDSKATNYLPIAPGWDYIVCFYRLRPEVLEGKMEVIEQEVEK